MIAAEVLCTFIYLQGSQTICQTRKRQRWLCTFIYLQGSQTTQGTRSACPVLCTFIYLQGSQTPRLREKYLVSLCTFIYLQGSQTQFPKYKSDRRFAPLFTYKVLKLKKKISEKRYSFAPLFTYKVLKPQIFFQGHHRTHNILAYVQAFSLYQRKTFSKLVMLICNNAIVIVKNIQFFTISFVIYTEFYQH